MAVDNFIYQGISRAVSDYTGARACEELINLRPTEGGLVPVKDFAAKFSNVDWDRVYVHYTTSGKRYIVVKHTSAAVQVYYLSNEADPTSLVSLFSVTTANAQDILDHLSYAAAGNIILFSICATGKYENHAFTWKMDTGTNTLTYVPMDGTAPDADFEIADDNTESGATSDLYRVEQQIMHLNEFSDVNECEEAVQAGLNAIMEENPDLCFGPILIAVAYKTTDGSTFWTRNWKVYDPVETIKGDSESTYVDREVEPSSTYASFFEKYGFGYLADVSDEMPADSAYLNHVTVAGTKVRLEFPAVSGWSEGTSIIESLEVYCSKPIPYLTAKGAKDGLFKITGGLIGEGRGYFHLYLPGIKTADMDLGSQLLYHQASISMASLSEGPQTVNLRFGGNAQLGEETLIADAGAIERYGRVLSYNARFHFFDSVAKMKIGMPSFAYAAQPSPTATKPEIFVRYVDDDQSSLVYVGQYPEYEQVVPNGAYVVVAPSLNITEVIEYFLYGGKYYVRSYRMSPSSSYNFSICTDGGTVADTNGSTTPIAPYKDMINNQDGDILTNVEPDAINVTEQYNPFVFRVEHSYKAPGTVIDVQPQMAGIVDASYGRDPLNVFTERGLYALTQGSANVLYGAFLPLSNLKGGRGGIPVEAGTFFLADGALWLVSGRRVTLVSEALTQGPHKYVRACTGYKKLSGTDTPYSPTPAPENPVYDVSPYLSQIEFKLFATGGQLAYNRYRMELFVSNPAYNYTYVLSLKNYQWHKVSKRMWQDEPGSTVINIPGLTPGTMSILDMSDEPSTATSPLLIHMQSRPFSLGYQYAHVHRIVAMMRAMLPTSSHKVAVGLYGSDDLQHWNLLSYGKWAGKTETSGSTTTNTPLYISQMRTPSSARSWRYYTVCIGGNIPVDANFPTDIGPVLVDYQPVNRRLG